MIIKYYSKIEKHPECETYYDFMEPYLSKIDTPISKLLMNNYECLPNFT